jgi:endonuclease YncB( thermonuclease family)
MTTKPYVYRITDVVKVTDGDTYWLQLDVGFRQTMLVNIRLSGYDTPERNRGTPFEKGEAVRAAVTAGQFFAPVEGTLWVRTEKDPDNFGRWLGDVWVESDGDRWPERHLGAELRSRGLASVWPTRWRDEFDKGRGGT